MSVALMLFGASTKVSQGEHRAMCKRGAVFPVVPAMFMDVHKHTDVERELLECQAFVGRILPGVRR